MAGGGAVFLDTSIQIARFVHGPQVKRRIRDRLGQFDLKITGTVVRQEFRRRFLKEARYLLEQLERRHSLEAVMRHVHDVLPPQQLRKQRICLQTLFTIFEGSTDADRTERARLFLKSLLKGGLEEFDQLVDHVIAASGCACGRRPIAQAKSGRFDFGTDRCSDVADSCEVSAFLSSRRETVTKIRLQLANVESSRKSTEIETTEEFLNETSQEFEGVESHDPCLTVGDFLIAIESDGIPTVYTMNGRESQHFCRALGQTMIVRKRNPDHDDVVCSHDDSDWPSF